MPASPRRLGSGSVNREQGISAIGQFGDHHDNDIQFVRLWPRPSAALGTHPLVQGPEWGVTAVAAQDDDRGAGAKAAGRALEIWTRQSRTKAKD